MGYEFINKLPTPAEIKTVSRCLYVQPPKASAG